MTAVRQLKRRPAKGVARRTVEVSMGGAWEGWQATAYADYKASQIADLTSGEIDRILTALDKVIITHNFPDADDDSRLAATLGDVDFEGLTAFIDEMFEAIGKLPKR